MEDRKESFYLFEKLLIVDSTRLSLSRDSIVFRLHNCKIVFDHLVSRICWHNQVSSTYRFRSNTQTSELDVRE